MNSEQDGRDQRDFGWCFLGSGGITKRVLADLPRTKGGYLATVWSRNPANAEKLAGRYGGRAFARLEDAVADPAVRAVYVATPHSAHRDGVLRALELGKPVLCEKPFALNAAQTREMQQAAKARGLFLMEAMWTRFNPAVQQALAWIRDGRIGRVWSLEAAFATRADRSIQRLFDPALGGGSLLDVGIYPVAFAHFVFGGSPEEIQAAAVKTPEGVDAQCAVLLRYQSGAMARLFSSIEVRTPHDAVVCGENGQIRLEKFWAPAKAQLVTADGVEVFDSRREGEGFQFEFDAAMEDIRAGRTENALHSHRDTLEIMEQLDAIRARIGVRYPGE